MNNGDYVLVKAPDDFPGTLYRNKYCYEHHLVFWQNFGRVPSKQEIIHHIDGNKHNNDISNLEILLRGEHTKRHNKGRTIVELECPACHQIFSREKRNTFLKKHTQYTCCSRKCIGYFSNLPKDVQQNLLPQKVIGEYRQK